MICRPARVVTGRNPIHGIITQSWSLPEPVTRGAETEIDDRDRKINRSLVYDQNDRSIFFFNDRNRDRESSMLWYHLLADKEEA